MSFGPEAVDQNNHVNNVEYVRWLQEVAIAHTQHNGWPMERLFEHHWTWVVRSHYIEYLFSAQAGEPISLYTWVANMKKIRSLRKYRFVRESDGTILANAQSDWIFLNIQTGRPTAIPPEITGAYDIISEAEESAIGKDLSQP